MEDDTRNLLEESLKHLGQYRDACADAGWHDQADSVGRLIEDIELRLDTSPMTDSDPSLTISLVSREGTFIPYRHLQRIIYTKALLISNNVREAARRLDIGKSNLYRHIKVSGIKVPSKTISDKL